MNRALTGASRLAVAAVGVSYGIPLYLAVDGVVPMGGTLFASDSLVNLIGYALGVAVAAAAGLAFGRLRLFRPDAESVQSGQDVVDLHRAVGVKS